MFEFRRGQGDRIGLHAAGLGGLFDDGSDIGQGESVAAERRDLQVAAKVVNPADAIGRGGSGLTRQKTCDLGEPAHEIRGGLPCLQGAKIGGQHMGQQGRADGAMGCWKHPANGGGKSVDGAESGIGKGQTATQAGEGHVGSGREIVTLGERAPQGARGPRNRRQAEGVHERIRTSGKVRFKHLGQRIHSGARRQGGWESQGEFRIHDGHARQHQGAAEAGFDAVLRGRENGVAGDLGTGAGGGGDGDQGQRGVGQGLSTPDHFEVVEQVAGIGGQGGDGLSRVDGAPAAQGDHAVTTGSTGSGSSVADINGGGLAGNGVEGEADGGKIKLPQERLRAAQGTTGDHERGMPESADDAGSLANGPGTEDDPVGGGEFESHDRRG